MGQAAHHYLIFETAGGFCGIAWNDAGITRFQLPTKALKRGDLAAKYCREAGAFRLLGPRLRR